MGNDWPAAIDGFCKIMDMPADAKQKWPTYMDAAKAKAEITPLLEEQFLKQPRDYWLEKLATTRIPFDVLAEFKDIQGDVQAWEGGFLMPNAVEGYNIGIPTCPGQFRNAGKAEITMNYPGEHTIEQFKAIGYSDEEIQALLDKGIATQLDPETYEYDRFNIMKPGTTYNMIMGGMSMGG